MTEQRCSFTYRRGFYLFGGVFLVAGPVLLLYYGILVHFTEEIPVYVNGQRVDSLPSHLFALLLAGAGAFLLLGVTVILQYLNEAIIVQGDTLTWIDYRRRVRVVSPLNDITDYGTSVFSLLPGAHFRIRTGHGNIHFTTYLTDWQELDRLVEGALRRRREPHLI